VLVGGRLLAPAGTFVVQLWAYDRRKQKPGALRLATGEQRCSGCNLSRLGRAAEQLLVRLIGERTAASPAQLTIRSHPPGAAVLLDGTPVGATELSLGVSPGVHALTLRKPGFAARSMRLRVGPGEQRSVVAALEPPRAARRTWSWLKWTLAGAAAASLGTGIALWAVGRDASPGSTGVETQGTDYRAPGIALTAGGTLLAGAALVGFWLDRPAVAEVRSATLILRPDGALFGYTRRWP
jgi:hypothetical protein